MNDGQFKCGLFNDAISSSHNIALNDRMISEQWIERIWKEAIVTI
jgi:hypothetical protein